MDRAAYLDAHSAEVGFPWVGELGRSSSVAVGPVTCQKKKKGLLPWSICLSPWSFLLVIKDKIISILSFPRRLKKTLLACLLPMTSSDRDRDRDPNEVGRAVPSNHGESHASALLPSVATREGKGVCCSGMLTLLLGSWKGLAPAIGPRQPLQGCRQQGAMFKFLIPQRQTY